MKESRRSPSFRVTGTIVKAEGVAYGALATLTVTGALSFTGAHCPPPCNWKVMSIPGVVQVTTRKIAHDSERSGRGRVVVCRKCRALIEVIEHA